MDFFTTFWHFLSISAPFLLLGLLASGLLQALVSAQQIKKNLAGQGLVPILKASLIGIPLPLCSCGVIPAGVVLKKQGASNGAISAFVIATPESGIDSIALTYALMDLPMAIIRPLAAGISAVVAGIAQEIFNPSRPPHAHPVSPGKEKSSNPNCCLHPQHPLAGTPRTEALGPRLKKGGDFVLQELLPDIAPWLVVGLVAGALISYWVPLGMLEQFNGFWGKMAMVAVGLPLYICASSSTPIAASLVIKGLSPGTALIFLLVGPATNITNMLVLQKYLGKKGILINIIVVALIAVGASYLVDYLYAWMKWPLNFLGVTPDLQHFPAGEQMSFILNILFSGLLIWGVAKRWQQRSSQHQHSQGCCP